MVPSCTQRIARILSKNLTPFLRARGFNKTGNAYLSEKVDLAWLISVQKSRLNDNKEVQITINGGVYIPGVVSEYARRSAPDKPTLADCCLSVRIGMLEESRRDKWWKITSYDECPNTTDEIIAAELHEWVEGLLLPFLAKFKSRGDVAAFLEGAVEGCDRFVMPQSGAQRYTYASLIFAQMGHGDSARRAIERAMLEAEGSPAAEFVRRVRERLLPV